MRQFEPLLGSIHRGVGERLPVLLPERAAFAELLDAFDLGHPIHHVPGAQLVQRTEVEVSKARMPAPRRVACFGQQTHGLRQLQ